MPPPPNLPGFLNSLAPLIEHYGYLAIGGLVMLEDFGVPSPGETLLITGAVYAGAGRLNIVLVALVGFVGAVIGDNIGYAIGRLGGHELAVRWGRYVGLTHERLARVEAFFARHGGKIVVVARFIEVLRQANGIVAGISEMPWLRFLGANVLGAALWVAMWTSIGYLAGTHLTLIYHEILRYELVAAGVVVVVVAGLVWHRLRARRARSRGGDAPSGGRTSGDDERV